MITDRIKEDLKKRGRRKPLSPPPLNFKGLIKLLESSDIEFVDSVLREARGMATIDKVHLNMDSLYNDDDKMFFFVILHEYCHGLRIKKMGKDAMITALSLDEFDDMAEHVIYEELLADRYASLKYYQLNKELFPFYRTQRLNETIQRVNYKNRIKPLHGVIQNSEEKYNELMNSFIIG